MMQRVPPLLRRSAAAFLIRGLEIAGKLGLYLLAARLLGAHEAGLFFICLTWAHLLSTVGRLGFDRAVTRHLAAEIAVRDGAAARRALGQALAVTLATSAGVGLLTWLAAAPLAVLVFAMPDLAQPLATAALLTAAQTLAFLLCAALVGLGRSLVSQFLQFAFWPLVGVAALLFGADSAEDLILALAGGMVTTLLAAGLLLWRSSRSLPRDAGAVGGHEPLPALHRTARSLMVVEMVQVGIANLPVLVLATAAPASTVGAFSVAMRLSMLVWMALISLTTIAAPQFAALHRRNELAALRQINRRIALLGGTAGGTAALAMLLLPTSLLGIVGTEYRDAAVVLQILAAGQLVNALFCGQDVLLAMSGHGRLLARLNLFQFCIGLVLMLLLVPWAQETGAAVAVAVVTAGGATANALAVRAVLGETSLPGLPAPPPGLVRALAGRDVVAGGGR